MESAGHSLDEHASGQARARVVPSSTEQLASHTSPLPLPRRLQDALWGKWRSSGAKRASPPATAVVARFAWSPRAR